MEYKDHDIKKISSGIGVMKQVRHFIRQATLHLIYRALRLSLFIYCNTTWENCGIALRNKLQKLRNRGANVITLI